jgi:hypothetical protein
MAKTTRRRSARLAYSISRLARESDISRSMIYEEIAAGHLIARKIGRRTIVRRADALAWLRSLPCLLPGDNDGITENEDSRAAKSDCLDNQGPATATEDRTNEWQAAGLL